VTPRSSRRRSSGKPPSNAGDSRGSRQAAAWAIDYHTRLDLPDAIHLSSLIEGLEPYFCEDLVRSENPAVYRTLRPQVKVPIAVGEHYGSRWDFNELIENRLIDYSRVTLPNVGGITEYIKIMALCETHYIGLIPHFTGRLPRPLWRIASRRTPVQ